MVSLKFLALMSTLLLAETAFAIPSPQSTTIHCDTGNNVRQALSAVDPLLLELAGRKFARILLFE
ncbi:hypothetical protein M422DRAFT_239154 [Sphaerobolus stellatus SS14]|nr:hypothetical protein M422DRAFT_239154 [Sphaerobolus stellatus SS14]